MFYILKKHQGTHDNQDYIDRVVKIFSLFSGGDILVRQKIAEVAVLKYLILVLPELKFENLLAMMKVTFTLPEAPYKNHLNFFRSNSSNFSIFHLIFLKGLPPRVWS